MSSALSLTTVHSDFSLQFGAATEIDVLQFDEKNMKLILRCPADFYVKLRAALTVASSYNDVDCYYKVCCKNQNNLKLHSYFSLILFFLFRSLKLLHVLCNWLQTVTSTNIANISSINAHSTLH